MDKLIAAGLARAGAVAVALAPVASADNNDSNNRANNGHRLSA